jgi:diaminopimelate epimerase
MYERSYGDKIAEEVKQGQDMDTLANEHEAELPRSIDRLAVMYPSGNTTAVVFDDILGAPREALNDFVMEQWKLQNPDQPEIEQCCFITEPQDPRAIARVEMFGGEFCGNATRSAVQLLTGGQDQQGFIEVSGAGKLLGFSVKDKKITVEMPLPNNADSIAEDVEEGVLVHLDGIAHVVVTDDSLRASLTARQLLEDLLKNNKYGLAEEPAFGVTYYDQETTKADFAVWVNEVNTTFDETACGSGTCSIGVAVAKATRGSVKLDVLQPSGQTISTESDFNGNQVEASRITGTVDTLHDGKFIMS